MLEENEAFARLVWRGRIIVGVPPGGSARDDLARFAVECARTIDILHAEVESLRAANVVALEAIDWLARTPFRSPCCGVHLSPYVDVLECSKCGRSAGPHPRSIAAAALARIAEIEHGEHRGKP
jgi:hypothetical protein